MQKNFSGLRFLRVPWEKSINRVMSGSCYNKKKAVEEVYTCKFSATTN